MKTQYKKLNDTWVISINGTLSYEEQEPLKKSLQQLVKQTTSDQTAHKVIFNFEKLEFVGSSGISQFIQTLKEVSQKFPIKPRYCNVSSEFKKIIKAYDETNVFEFFENEEKATQSFTPISPTSQMDH